MKAYMKPALEITLISATQMIALSGSDEITGKLNTDNILKYGGVDADGTKDPMVKRRNIWEEKW